MFDIPKFSVNCTVQLAAIKHKFVGVLLSVATLPLICVVRSEEQVDDNKNYHSDPIPPTTTSTAQTNWPVSIFGEQIEVFY